MNKLLNWLKEWHFHDWRYSGAFIGRKQDKLNYRCTKCYKVKQENYGEM